MTNVHVPSSLRNRTPRLWLRVSVGVFVALSAIALSLYGGLTFWPAIATEFGASLAAFMLALAWEAHREQEALRRVEAQTHAARETEARKRLLALVGELKRNKKSLDTLEEGLAATPAVFNVLNPELLDAAWASSGERLGDLLADYALVAELATFYGRVEELRWRIRRRTETLSTYLDEMTKPLVEEMQGEVASLLPRVEEEAKKPEVRAVGLVHMMSTRTATETDTAMPITPA